MALTEPNHGKEDGYPLSLMEIMRRIWLNVINTIHHFTTYKVLFHTISHKILKLMLWYRIKISIISNIEHVYLNIFRKVSDLTKKTQSVTGQLGQNLKPVQSHAGSITLHCLHVMKALAPESCMVPRLRAQALRSHLAPSIYPPAATLLVIPLHL